MDIFLVVLVLGLAVSLLFALYYVRYYRNQAFELAREMLRQAYLAELACRENELPSLSSEEAEPDQATQDQP